MGRFRWQTGAKNGFQRKLLFSNRYLVLQKHTQCIVLYVFALFKSNNKHVWLVNNVGKLAWQTIICYSSCTI